MKIYMVIALIVIGLPLIVSAAGECTKGSSGSSKSKLNPCTRSSEGTLPNIPKL